MTGFEWNQHSKDRMGTLHPDLVRVLQAFAPLSPYECVVAQGNRTAEEEMGLWLKCHNPDGTRNGEPWLTNCNGYQIGELAPNGIQGTGVSNHQGGYAVDLGVLINGIYVGTLDKYHAVAAVLIPLAKSMGIEMIYGGTWQPPKTDSDHFELNRAFYPASGVQANAGQYSLNLNGGT